MSKARAGATLSGMIDTDMEEDTLNGDAFPTPDSNQENTGPARRKDAKGKPATKKFTKTKVPSKRNSGNSVATKSALAPKAKSGKKRMPLKEQTNQQYAGDTEEVDEFAAEAEGDIVMDELMETKQRGKKKPIAKKGGRPPKKTIAEQVGGMQKDGEFEYTPTAARTTKAGKKPRPSEETIQKTQEPMEMDQSILPEEEDDDEREVPQSVFRRTNNVRNTSQRRQALVPRRRAGSASDTERTGVDPATRRKLGDLTRKFENLDFKYRNLREVGIKDAEANFEKLRTQSEAKAKAANELILSLQKELATQKSLTADTTSIQKQIVSRDEDLSKTRALADSLSASLAEAQNENKVLATKLANSRSASATVESLGAKTPGSALRARQQLGASRTIMVGSAEAAQAAQIAQLKEDLYSDLTGLILRGVEKGSESDVYDCIQTGRNGTLHFKLGIAKQTDDSYENTEFQYTPRLDSNRDRDLIAMLPEYLTDEITFARTNAALFYGRVVETLTKRRRVEDE